MFCTAAWIEMALAMSPTDTALTTSAPADGAMSEKVVPSSSAST